MRYRYVDNRYPAVATNYITETSCSQQEYQTLLEYGLGQYMEMNDVVTPNFKQRIANGEIVNNPMHRYEATRVTTGSNGIYGSSGSPCSYRKEQAWTAVYNNSFPDLLRHLVVPIGMNDVINLAASRAWSRVSEADFEGATFLAELKETINFAANPLDSITEGLKDIRRSSRKARTHSVAGRIAPKVDSVFDFMSSNWLAYRYAVMPSVYDFEDAVKAIDSLADKGRRKTARASEQRTEESSGLESGGTYAWNMERSITTTRTYSVRAGVLYEQGIKNSFGVRFHDVVPALYEAVPLSFVLDWFSNLGTFIRAIQPRYDVEHLASWFTTLDEHHSVATATATSQNLGWATYYSDPYWTELWKTQTKNRTPQLPGASLSVDLPLSIKDFGIQRLLDGIALVKTILFSR